MVHGIKSNRSLKLGLIVLPENSLVSWLDMKDKQGFDQVLISNNPLGGAADLKQAVS